jgi:phospholipid/cholesterol/gamma-HCH transport system permease protein
MENQVTAKFMYRFFALPGAAVLRIVSVFGEISLLFLQTCYWIIYGRIFTRSLLQNINSIGIQSLPLISFTALFSGMVLVVQVGNQFMELGAENYIGGVVGLSLTRELAPLMVSTILAARIGSSMAAELGTMRVTEQIDALEVMATNPVQHLVVPRIMACTIFTPILVVYSNIIGIIGGLSVAIFQIGCNYSLFIESLQEMVTATDFISGLLKSAAFGFVVALVGCFKGLNTKGGAKGVGEATTQTVVIIITTILVMNYFFSLAFFAYLKYAKIL